MRISILKTGFATVQVDVNEGTSVADALRQAEVNHQGYNIIIDGSPATPESTIVSSMRAISLVGKVKGGADVVVKVVKFGQPTVSATVSEGSTVRDAIKAINYGLDGYTISLNGAPATLESIVNDTDIIQLVPKVKGGLILI